MVKVVITILLSLLVVLILFGLIIPAMIKKNSKIPGFDRRWTDPKHHDKLD